MSEAKFLMQLGERIQTIRKEKTLSQMELASRCGFGKATMSRIESGKANPTVLTLRKVSTALGVEPFELFK